MTHRTLNPLLPLCLPLFLAACQGPPAPPVTLLPAASSATINGARVLDDRTYQLGVSALDGTQVLTNATLSSPVVTTISAGQASATVCGQIQGQDVLTTAITLDSTGSMVDTDPQQLRKQAAQAFVRRMTSKDRAAVLSFDTGSYPSTGLQAAYVWQPFTADQSLLNAGIDHATFAGGGTNLYDAVIDADTLLRSGTGSNRNILVMTDGADNSSSAVPDDVIAAAKKDGVRVFAVGLDTTNTLGFADLERIASQTGGLFQKATDAAQLKDYFDHMYNAVTAQGCLQLNFTALPTPGTVVTGTVAFTVSSPGKQDASFTLPFTFTAR